MRSSARVRLLVLLLGAGLSGCGLIFGDEVHWGFPLLRLSAALVVGIALGYGLFRYAQHGWRSARRERREARRDNREDRRNPPTTTPT